MLTYNLRLTTYDLRLTTYDLRLTTYDLRLTTYDLRLTTYDLRLTTYDMSKFITFEGVDGAGKSTHLAWFADTLRQRGPDVLVTREPGGTPLGEQLREILLNQPMSIGT